MSGAACQVMEGQGSDVPNKFASVPPTRVLALPGLIGSPMRLSQMVFKIRIDFDILQMDSPEGLFHCCGQNPLTPGLQTLLMSPFPFTAQSPEAKGRT